MPLNSIAQRQYIFQVEHKTTNPKPPFPVSAVVPVFASHSPISFSSCKWLRPEACVYFCHCWDCNMCQSQSQYHTPAPSPSPLLPFAIPLPCLRTNLIEVSLSIFTLVFLLSYNCFLSFLVARFAGNSN